MSYSNKIMYFLGIGGIGMSALARWCKNQGAIIYGYDLHSSELTNKLIKEGMNIHFDEDINQLPANIDIVVYTPAIPKNNVELVYLKETEIPIFKRSELIGNISSNYTTVAVAGTHGKTSISALAAHLLKNANINVTAFIGGICKNYRSNLILSESTDYLIVEADEYDKSLLKINPDIVIISSMDQDHLDIYQDHNDIKTTFIEFAQMIPTDGVLIYNSKLPAFNTKGKHLTYGIEDKSSVYASNIQISHGKFVIDINTKIGKIDNVEIQIPGIHNIENTLAAVGIALEVGLSADEIVSGIETFTGVERRMDFRVINEDIVYIDDYAHHPEEIKATISAIRKLYPDKRITGIFQPHLFSRTRDFSIEFATELSKLDELILMDIYPAREKPIEGITSNTILDKITIGQKQIMDNAEILEYISETTHEVLITLGAGDIGQLAKSIEAQILQN